MTLPRVLSVSFILAGEDLLWPPIGIGPQVWPPSSPLPPHRVRRPVRHGGISGRRQRRHTTHQQVQQ